MPFGMWSRVGARSRFPLRMDNFEGGRAAHYKVKGLSALSCAKTAEPIDVPFGMWTRMGARKHVLDELHIGANW